MKCPNNKVEVLLGDFNVKVRYKDQERALVGKYSLHKDSNDSEFRLIGLGSALNIMVAVKFFRIRISI
jgi:hypothetical protein